MTGYGRARKTLNGRDITVEVRSVNNRYLDCSVKMPRAYIFAEDAVKSLVQKNVSRGKVDVFITVDSLGSGGDGGRRQRASGKELHRGAEEAVRPGGGSWVKSSCYATDLARLPDVLTITKAEEDLDSLSADLCAVLEEALAAHAAMRETEGRKLADDLGVELCGVLLGSGVNEQYAKALGGYGADKVYICDHELLKDYTTDAYTKVLCDLVEDKKPEVFLIGATNIGRDLGPRVAARLHTGLTADCTHLDVDVEKYKAFLKTTSTIDVDNTPFEDNKT